MSTKKGKSNFTPLSYEEYQKKVSKLSSVDDVSNFTRELVAPLLQELLEAEMDEHLGYTRHSKDGDNSGNNRNGHRQKILKGEFGQSEIAIPRDRNGKYTPKILKNGTGVISGDMEEKIIALYGSGHSTRMVSEQLSDLYKVDVAPQYISMITNKILPFLQEWQQRPLEVVYPIMYLDGIHFKVRHNGKIVSKVVYTVLAINKEGKKELLGLWISENEGAKFWLQVLTEIKNRGVQDVLIVCIDGLSGFSEAIHTVFPKVLVQRCIVHQIRSTTRYISWKDRKALCADLKTIYTAPTAEAGYEALQQVKKNWPTYEAYLKSWENNWNELAHFFQFDKAIRKLIYTTNPIESVHRQFRKATKSTTIFPHDEAVLKRLYLTQKKLTNKWTMRIQNWPQILAQLTITFSDRISI